MENKPDEMQEEESFLKPKVKAKRNLTDEQRLILAERMRAINDKRIADAMAKKQAEKPQPVVETPKSTKQTKKKTIKIVEISEPEDESESEEEQIIYVQKPPKQAPAKKTPVKKAPAKKPKPVYESEDEEEEAPKSILKPRKQKAQAQPLAPEPPKILFRFL